MKRRKKEDNLEVEHVDKIISESAEIESNEHPPNKIIEEKETNNEETKSRPKIMNAIDLMNGIEEEVAEKKEEAESEFVEKEVEPNFEKKDSEGESIEKELEYIDQEPDIENDLKEDIKVTIAKDSKPELEIGIAKNPVNSTSEAMFLAALTNPGVPLLKRKEFMTKYDK